MDNQQRSSKENVQRLSRQGVLDNIIWETPHNEYYIYELVSNEETKYIGLTANPEERFRQHLIVKAYNLDEKSKWIAKCILNDDLIYMKVKESYKTLKEVVEREEYLIKNTENLLNINFNQEYVKLYDTVTGKVIHFEDRRSAYKHFKMKPHKNTNSIKKRYYFYKDNKLPYQYKAIKDGIKLYFVNVKDIARHFKVTEHFVSLNIQKLRKTVKGWTIKHINDNDEESINSHFKRVKCIDDGKEFKNIKEAEDYYKIKNIHKVCKKTRKTAGGKRFEYIEDIVHP